MLLLDGNTTRRAFEDTQFISDITGFPLDLIVDLWDLHVALSCSLPLCPIKIQSFCLDFKARYDAAIDWWPLPPAILSVVDHFHEVIEVFPPTIRSGMLRYYFHF